MSDYFNIEDRYFLKYYNGLSNEGKLAIINDPNLVNLSDNKYRYIFYNSGIELTETLLQNEQLYDKVMRLPYSLNGRTLLNILKENKVSLLKLLIESKYSFKYKDSILDFVDKLPSEEYKKLAEQINFSNVIFNDYDIDTLKEYFKKYNNKYFDDIFPIFYKKLKDGKLDISMLLKIKNFKQFLLYSKFGVLIDLEDGYDENITLSDGLVLPLNKLVTSKETINKLIEELKVKSPCSDLVAFEVCFKLCYLFGYDNAKKIIEDNFTYITEMALNRITDSEFKKERNDYRTKNQDMFYHYNIIEKIRESLESDDKQYLKKLAGNFVLNIDDIIDQFKELYDNFDFDKVKNGIDKLIYDRESELKSQHYAILKNSIKKRSEVSSQELYDLFRGVDMFHIVCNSDSYTVPYNTKICNLFLGNATKDNNCLLRLILNNRAFGLEDNISKLINRYDMLEKMTLGGKLSFGSVNDIVDMLKADLFELKPNETDIQLSTLTRLINSIDYKDNEIDIVNETRKIHVKRKEKVYATIPTVSGKTEHYKYYVAPFDAEYLLTAGLDGKNCFRLSSSFGGNFYKYCLTNPNAIIVYLEDNTGKKHICPVIRSGNAINCNGIEPEVDANMRNNAVEALSKCFSEMIERAYLSEDHTKNIEVATLTDLKLHDYFVLNNYTEYKPQVPLPLNCNFYSDYNKNEIKHYVIAKASTYKKDYYYFSDYEFTQKREKDYTYQEGQTEEKDKINKIINSINYTAISYFDISEEEKISMRRKYENIDVDKFRALIGNKDWFVGITKQNDVIHRLIYFDKRARAAHDLAYSQALKFERMENYYEEYKGNKTF